MTPSKASEVLDMAVDYPKQFSKERALRELYQAMIEIVFKDTKRYPDYAPDVVSPTDELRIALTKYKQDNTTFVLAEDYTAILNFIKWLEEPTNKGKE